VVQDITVMKETLKLFQERIEKVLEHIGISKNFLNSTSMAQQVKERIDKWY
jgi:hypothetical protein